MAITVRADVEDGEQGVSVTQENRPLLKDIEAHLPSGQGGGKREVVVLEVANDEVLRKTHARYFKSAQALVSAGIPARKSL